MIQRIRKFFSPTISTFNWIELSQKALSANYDYLQGLAGRGIIIPVLKSNAYGHGLREICVMLSSVQCSLVAVDSYPEYQIVASVSSVDILIMEEMDHTTYRYLDVNRAIICVYNIDTLRYLISLGKPFKIHLFCNTGMNREGIQLSQLDEFLQLLSSSTIQLDGVLSHLSCADHQDVSFTNIQTDCFKSMYDIVLSYGFTPRLRHINNSAGLLGSNDDFWNAHRVGLALYGYDSLGNYQHFLQPVMSVWSRIVGLQYVHQGETVGYGDNYCMHEDGITATVPFGYTEGLWRIVSGRRSIKHAGGYLGCAGRISMNLSSWVAGDAVQIGDEVCVISDQLGDENSFVKLAEQCGTIIYEVLVRVDRGIRRKIV